LATAALVAQPSSTPAASKVQPPVFHTGVDLVVVEATAVDKAGVVVTGLGPADFQAEIAGRAREVVSAEFVEYAVGARVEAPANVDITTNAATPSRTVLVVVDQSSLRLESRGVLEGAKRWLATLAPSDRLGLVGLPPPGPVVDFTTDHAKVVDAFSSLKGGAVRLSPPHINRNVSVWEAFQINDRNDVVRAEVIARECRQGDPTCPGDVLDNVRSIVVDSGRQVEPVVTAMGRVLRGLRSMPGPKHMVLISSGWPIDERDSTSQLTALAEEAALSNVTVHVFTVEESQTSASLVRISPKRSLDQNLLLTSVETLAGYTGGRSVRTAGNGELAFKSLDRMLSGYYRLAVRVTPEDLDGKSKRVGLKVTRSGVSLLGYRRILAATTPSAGREAAPAAAAPSASAGTSAAMVREALNSTTPLTVLGLRATSYVIHGETGPGSVKVVVVGDVDRAAKGPATVVAVLYGPDGKPAAGTEQTVQIPAAGPARIVTMLAVKPGTYALRLAVADRDGRAGTLDRNVETTWRQAGGVATTGLVVFRTIGGPRGSLQPLFDVASTADQLIAQLPLSGPLADPNGQVTYEVAREGTTAPLMRLSAQIGKTSTGALVAEGKVPPNELSPGRYTIAASIEPGFPSLFKRTFVVEAAK